MPKNSDYSVRAVERALQILKAFDEQKAQLSYVEIAARTGIPVTTVFKHLQVLRREDFLVECDEEGTFAVGPESFRLGMLYVSGRGVVDAANAHLTALAGRLGTTVTLAIRDRDCSVTVVTKESESPFRLMGRLGGRWPLQRSALGKALLLDVETSELHDILPPAPWPQATPHSLAYPEQLQAQLYLFRAQGFTVDDEKSVRGISCVGAPIRNHEGTIVAAISTSGVKAALTRPLVEIGAEIRVTAGLISRELGHIP